jgi:hypothetical protein
VSPTPLWQTHIKLGNGNTLTAYQGKALSFQNQVLKLQVEPGKTLDVMVNNSTQVMAGTSTLMDYPANAALPLAIQNNLTVVVAYAEPAPLVATVILATFPANVVIPTLPPQTVAAQRAQIIANATPTLMPVGFIPTATPVLAHRIAEFPWGKVDLDLPLEQANEYARATACGQTITWVPPEKFSMWATNPQGMISGVGGAGYFHNVEILSRDAAWRINPDGSRFVQAVGLIRFLPRSNENTRKIALTIYEGAPIQIVVPTDARSMGGFGMKKDGNGEFVQTGVVGGVLAPTTFSVTDPNQLRIGQMVGIVESADLFHHPSRSLITEFTINKSDPWTFQPGAYSSMPWHSMVYYTQAPDPLASCDKGLQNLRDLGTLTPVVRWIW